MLAGALRLADFFCSFAILCDSEKRLSVIFMVEIVAIAAVMLVLATVFHVRFDPARLAYLTLGISALAFATNLLVARRAYRRVAVVGENANATARSRG